MKITCPQCEFSREMSDDKIPTKPIMATCPQCQHRFRVERDSQSVHTEQTPAAPQNTTTHTEQTHSHSAHQPQQPSFTPSSPLEKDQPVFHHERKTQNPSYEAHKENRDLEEAEEEDMLFDAYAIANPLTSIHQHGYLAAFYHTVMRILFSASRFFAGLMPTNSYKEPLIFFVIIGILQTSIEYFWTGQFSELLIPILLEDPEMHNLATWLSNRDPYTITIFYSTLVNIAKIFFATALYYVIFKMFAPERTKFSLMFQVLCYSVAPSLLCIVPALGSLVGYFWSLVCFAIGCRYTLRLDWGRTILGVILPFLVLVPLITVFLLSI